jgi:pimeloyl-ACP methyl ester carboxylesterase
MDELLIPLKRDPSIQLSCTFFGSVGRCSPRKTLIVCISGIDNSQRIWYPTVTAFFQTRDSTSAPPILTYDRSGIGKSVGKNAEVEGRPKGHGRDCLDAAHDLRDIITQVGQLRLGINENSINELRIIFVTSSIGTAIARLYCTSYPKTVTGLVILDSTLANSNTRDIFPDPKVPGFVESDLPDGITGDLCVLATNQLGQIYASDARNREGLWRGNLPSLLPYADSPKLQGPISKSPYVTVVEHDRALFGEVAHGVSLPSYPNNFYSELTLP